MLNFKENNVYLCLGYILFAYYERLLQNVFGIHCSSISHAVAKSKVIETLIIDISNVNGRYDTKNVASLKLPFISAYLYIYIEEQL